MTNRMTMALMAAALILAVQGHPRAQSPDCPCGNPADLVPLAEWPTDVADCAADPTRTALYGFSFEGGIVSVALTSSFPIGAETVARFVSVVLGPGKGFARRRPAVRRGRATKFAVA